MPNESGRKPVLHTKKHIARLERERRQTRIILYSFIGILVVVLLLIGYGYLDVNYLQLNKPVARVGGTEISARDFETRVRLQRQQLLNSYNMNMQYSQVFGMDTSKQLTQIETYLNTPDLIGQTVLDQMINEELIRQEAVKRNISVSPDELQQFIQTQFGYFPNGTLTPTVTPTQIVPPTPPADAFKIVTITPTANPTLDLTPSSTSTPEPTAVTTSTLAPTATDNPTETVTPTATPYTLEGFQTQYGDSLKSFTRVGLSEEGYRNLVEVGLLQSKLTDLIAADVKPVEEQVWARHILVSDENLAKTIIEKLKAGQDFASLASEYSEDSGSKVNGGDLGWFGKGAMVAEFETAAFALKTPGDFTLVPVKSQFGYHIIQLIARQDRPLTPTQFETARKNAFSEWLTALRKKYSVETFDDLWKSIVPTEPNFITMATEAVDTANTRKAESTASGTASP